MSFNIEAYFNKKSIKLSDSYKVRLVKDKKTTEVLCASFTIPKLEFNEELYTYGNVGQTFLIPKYDSIKEVTIELYHVSEYIKKLLTKNGQVRH